MAQGMKRYDCFFLSVESALDCTHGDMKLVKVAFIVAFFFLLNVVGVVIYFGTEDYDDSYLPLRSNTTQLCVIIPFRNRLEELKEFAPHMSSFLNNQGITHHIIIMNQTDEYRFNRASLINVGWYESDRIGCSYMVMHDVDLLPQNPNISYKYPGDGIVRHISAPEYHPKYHYANFIGGVLMLTMGDYKKLNGMSNKYWGWGMEDDEFFLRIRESNLLLTRVSNLTTDHSNSFRHIHGPERKRDYAVVTKDQKAMKRKRDRISGLSNVAYQIRSRQNLEILDDLRNKIYVRAVNVKLKCDHSWTPYCIQPR